MPAGIDDVDRRLLDALLADGRASASDLAAAAGVATSTATERLGELEERGVVEGYRPDLDYRALGYDVTAVFRLAVAGGGLRDVVADLEASGRMVDVYEVTGATDIVAVGKFRSTEEMNARIKDLVADEHVRSVDADIVRNTVSEGDPPPVPPG